ncbi:MAG: HAD-IA family hydrolase [Desulfuromonadales bacterium]|nr:HAD-IA family hydrolase [Desulfuromonadales bacterium]
MASFDTLLFDLDGTLVDSSADLATAVNCLRLELELPPLPLATVRGYVGDGARLLVTRALPEFSEPHLQRFLQLYHRHLLDQTLPYPGIREFLQRRRHQRLAVVTNKPLQLSLELLAGLDLLAYFPVVVGGDSCREKKPHPAPLQLALQRLGSHPERAVMIGDHHTDLHAGRAAGVQSCFCQWGIGHDGGLASDFRAASPTDLDLLFPPEQG